MRIREVSFGAGGRYWFPFVVILLILLLAPIVANAQATDSVTVRWTAPGDDGTGGGRATAYDLRVSDSPITNSNFSAADTVAAMPGPGAPGSHERVVVRGLTHGTTYYFAIRTRDDRGNWSPLSNVVMYDWVLDSSPPQAPVQIAGGITQNGGVTITWAANTEPDLAGYRVFRATSQNGPFAEITTAVITTTSYTDPSPPANAADVWYRIAAVDTHGNTSAESAPIGVVLTSSSATMQALDPYPNPSRLANPVYFPVVVPAGGAADVSLDIYDSGEHRVYHHDFGTLTQGSHDTDIRWDGMNDAGQRCAPGAYRGWIATPGSRLSVRLVRVP